MGCNFCQKKVYRKINYLAPQEIEIEIKDYSSNNDKNLEVLEERFNFFKFVQLVEYVNLLDQFNAETSTVVTDEPMRIKFSSKDKFLDENISLEGFQSFIENKIFILEEFYDIMENNAEAISIFKLMCKEIYKALDEKLKNHYNNNISTDLIKKRNLLSIGILFCSCENIEKIKLFFDIFYIENEHFTKSEELNDFLLSHFLIASYCLISARNKIYDEKLKIEKLDKQDLTKLVNVSELKDCEDLVKLFNENFFEKESYKWEEFKGKFEDFEKGFGWILSSKGIRRKLEKKII